MRGRITLACLVTFAAGMALPDPIRAVVGLLWGSYAHPSERCIDYNAARCTAPLSLPARVLVTVALVAVLGLIVWMFRAIAPRVLRPVTSMTGTVRHMGPDNLGQRIRWSGMHDELRELADAVDTMLDRVAAGFEGQRHFAANASHELRTPLAVQRTLLEVAMTTTNGANPDLNRLGAQLLLVNDRNERLIDGLLVLAESHRGLVNAAPLRLDQLAKSVLDAHAELAVKHQVSVHHSLAARTVTGDPVLLERLIVNLVHNAIKYNRPGGRVEIGLAGALTVRNTGQPVPAEAIPSLFEPFRRLTAERVNHRDGAGLGLAIVRSIVAAHRGTVQAEPGQDGGLLVTVALP